MNENIVQKKRSRHVYDKLKLLKIYKSYGGKLLFVINMFMC